MRLVLALHLAFICSILLAAPARAAAVIPENDAFLTTMDYHDTVFEADPNNPRSSDSWPADRSATSSTDKAAVSLSAVAGEAGVAKASVGVALDWDTSGVAWEEIENIPILVEVHFRYELAATWTQATGSSNAGVTIPGLLTTPWLSFYGHAEGDNGGSRSGSEVAGFLTTPGELRVQNDDKVYIQVYAQAHATNHPDTTQNSASAEVTVHSVRITWRPPEADLEATALEVTQAIQDLNQSVSLIARKPTFVRFHVHSLTPQSYPTDATLTVTRGEQSAVLRPIQPTYTVNVRPNPQRGQLVHAFLFEIPRSLTGPGEITLAARVNPDEDSPLEANYENNRTEVTVEFEESPILDIIFYRVGYTHNGATQWPPLSHIEATESWLRRAFPVRAIRTWRRSFHAGHGVPSANDVNDHLIAQQARDRSSNTTVLAEGTRYYGMVHDSGGFMRGLAVPLRPLSPGALTLPYVAAGPTGIPTGVLNWDTDGTYGDWYAGHELGHTYARRHPGHPHPAGSPARAACGAQNRDARHPPAGDHPGGYISTDTAGPNALFGFDIATLDIYPPRPWSDMMTYCSHIWISDFTYQGLLDFFRTRPVSYAQTQAPLADYLLLLGSIDPDTGDTRLRRPTVIPEASNVSPPTSGDYAIVLRNAEGDELAQHPFTPILERVEPDLTAATTDEQEILLIAEMVPALPQATSLEILSDTTVLAEVEAGTGIPTVQVTAPNGGETVDGDTVTVTWNASDPDDDPLTFDVGYSPDGGATWTTLGQFLTDTSLTISTTNLIAGDEGVVRVWASDGLHFGSDDSDALFTVANHAPQIAIRSPISGSTFIVSETVSLAATAYDPDLGTLTDEHLAWTSSLDGSLGAGPEESVADLSPGVHTITLSADDGETVVTDSVVITIPLLASLATVADALLVYPSSLTLSASDPTSSVLFTLDNQNAENTLTWQAVSDQPWLTFDQEVGATPGDTTVNIGALPDPTSPVTATLTFTSPDTDDQVLVPMRFTLSEPSASDEEYRLLLPALLSGANQP